jgi:protoheme IX farnesyltransferase
MIFATILGVLGFASLIIYTNITTVLIGVIGFVDYIVLYGIAKRNSIHGTIVGSISGATPPVAGYTAVTNQFDVGALLLFLILVFWQMPHFYAIAIYRIKDYKSASIPVWPIVKGMRSTKIQIVVYTIGFIVVTSLLTIYGYTGYTYLIAMLILGCIWLVKGINGFKTKNNTKWAGNIFSFSLVVLLSFSILISLENFLP